MSSAVIALAVAVLLGGAPPPRALSWPAPRSQAIEWCGASNAARRTS
jgi:hypothetical protein